MRGMSQVEVATTPRFAKHQRRGSHVASSRPRASCKTFEWTWTTAIVFSIALTFSHLDHHLGHPVLLALLRRPEAEMERRGAERLLVEGARDAIAMGLATAPIIVILVVAAVVQNWRRKLRGTVRRRAPHGRIPQETTMVFTKTEVDIHEDYVVRPSTPAWLAQGVKSPKHLMLDPDNCILCRACEDVCPWNCIYMLSTDIVEGADESSVEAEVAPADRDLRGRRQRVHAVLRLRGPMPHRHAVLCAPAGGFDRRNAPDGRGPPSQAAAE